MKELHIDIECFSSAELPKSGVYRYVESPDFEILLYGFSADGGPVQVVDLVKTVQNAGLRFDFQRRRRR